MNVTVAYNRVSFLMSATLPDLSLYLQILAHVLGKMLAYSEYSLTEKIILGWPVGKCE